MTEIQETVAISKFKATCLEMLEHVRRTGRPLVITKRGTPIALVTPPPPTPPTQSWLGAFTGSARIVGDIVSPALDASEWEALRR
jgi:prevent-host-death family protein